MEFMIDVVDTLRM